MSGLQQIEQRMSALEELLLKPVPSASSEEQKNLVQTAADVNTAYTDALKSKERLAAALKSIDMKRLSALVDPGATCNDADLPEEIKLELINGKAPIVRQRIAMLQLVDANKDALDSEHLHPNPEFDRQLSEIRLKQNALVSGCKEQTESVSQLLRVYNKLIFDISKQFVAWDKVISEHEKRSFD